MRGAGGLTAQLPGERGRAHLGKEGAHEGFFGGERRRGDWPRHSDVVLPPNPVPKAFLRRLGRGGGGDDKHLGAAHLGAGEGGGGEEMLGGGDRAGPAEPGPPPPPAPPRPPPHGAAGSRVPAGAMRAGAPDGAAELSALHHGR